MAVDYGNYEKLALSMPLFSPVRDHLAANEKMPVFLQN
jgi:hypothetical protein